MSKLQEQVRRLEALAAAEDRYKLAYLLVGESGGVTGTITVPQLEA